jgi:hypothetical protein
MASTHSGRSNLSRSRDGPFVADRKRSGVFNEGLFAPHHVRRPYIRHGPGLDTGEPLFRHTDDLKLFLSKPHPAAQDPGTPAKPPRPEIVAQHGHRMLAWLEIVGFIQHPAQCRLDPKHRKCGSRNPLRIDFLGLSAGIVEDRLTPRLKAHAEELHLTAARLTHALEQWVIEERGILIVPRCAVNGIDQPLRLVHREGSQDQRIDERKCASTGPDCQGERHDRRCRDRRVLATEPQPEGDILHNRFEPRKQFDFPTRLAHQKCLPQLTSSLLLCVSGCHSTASEIFGPGGKVKLEFLIKVLI